MPRLPRAAALPLVFVLPLVLPLVSTGRLSAQKVHDIVGVHRCRPGLVPPLVLDRIMDPEGPCPGRPLVEFRMALHESVPAEVRLEQERSDLFEIKATPPSKRKQLIIPGLLDLTLRYDRRLKRVHRWEIKEVTGKLLMYSHSGSLLRLRRGEVCFLDLNHDGAFGGSQDGYVIRQHRSRQWIKPGVDLDVRKMEDPLQVADGQVWFHVDSAGFGVAVATTKPDFSIERRKDYQDALAHLNSLRKQLGHDPLGLDPSLVEACEKHCLYCSLNDDTTHDEERGKPGYSPEGAKAGKASELVRASSLSAAIDIFLSGFFHRIRMLSPCLEEVGMGNIGGHTALDTGSHYRQRSFTPYAWPCDGATDVPVTWTNGEFPHPLGREGDFTLEEARGYGYPVTLTFPSTNVKDVDVKMRTADGKTCGLVVRSPEKPACERFPDNYCSLFIMGRSPLSAKTTYTVTVDCSFRGRPFHKEWSFTTK